MPATGQPMKYPMIVRKVCPYCGKGNDILMHRWQDNRPRMFCPGTNHGSLNKRKNLGWVDKPDFKEEVKEPEPEVTPEPVRSDEVEYVAQLRKSYNLT